MKINTIIYDFDGVICNSVHIKTDAFMELYRAHNITVKEKIKKYHILNGGISRIEKLKYFEHNILNKNTNLEEINKLAYKFSMLVKKKVIEAEYILGVKEFLIENSKLTQQFICTGTPEDEILSIVQKSINAFFDGVYGSPKTKKEIIDKILMENNISPNQCVFFGDSMTDYHASESYQIPFIGIKNKDTIFPKNTILINNFIDLNINYIMKILNNNL